MQSDAAHMLSIILPLTYLPTCTLQADYEQHKTRTEQQAAEQQQALAAHREQYRAEMDAAKEQAEERAAVQELNFNTQVSLGTCTLGVHCMCTACALHVHCMCTALHVHVHSITATPCFR